MKNMDELLPKISPNCNPKYSNEIYSFLSRKKNRSFYDRVVYVPFSIIDGMKLPDFNINEIDMNSIFLAYIDNEYKEIIGTRLSSITTNNHQIFCYPGFDFDSIVDVTDEFWERYISQGVCFLDKKHSLFRRDWIHESNDEKKCPHCGLVLYKKEVVKVRIDHVWEEEKSNDDQGDFFFYCKETGDPISINKNHFAQLLNGYREAIK